MNVMQATRRILEGRNIRKAISESMHDLPSNLSGLEKIKYWAEKVWGGTAPNTYYETSANYLDGHIIHDGEIFEAELSGKKLTISSSAGWDDNQAALSGIYESIETIIEEINGKYKVTFYSDDKKYGEETYNDVDFCIKALEKGDMVSQAYYDHLESIVEEEDKEYSEEENGERDPDGYYDDED